MYLQAEYYGLLERQPAAACSAKLEWRNAIWNLFRVCPILTQNPSRFLEHTLHYLIQMLEYCVERNKLRNTTWSSYRSYLFLIPRSRFVEYFIITQIFSGCDVSWVRLAAEVISGTSVRTSSNRAERKSTQDQYHCHAWDVTSVPTSGLYLKCHLSFTTRGCWATVAA